MALFSEEIINYHQCGLNISFVLSDSNRSLEEAAAAVAAADTQTGSKPHLTQERAGLPGRLQNRITRKQFTRDLLYNYPVARNLGDKSRPGIHLL